jgi:hypothetical protein
MILFIIAIQNIISVISKLFAIGKKLKLKSYIEDLFTIFMYTIYYTLYYGLNLHLT